MPASRVSRFSLLPDEPIRFAFSRTVRWRDTDASGFANLSAYITWMEETEYAFLRSRDLSVVLSDQKGLIGFPRLNSELKIHHPVQFDQQLMVQLELIELDGKQLAYQFHIHEANDRTLVAEGVFTMACCRFPGDDLPFAILIPSWIEEKLTRAP